MAAPDIIVRLLDAITNLAPELSIPLLSTVCLVGACLAICALYRRLGSTRSQPAPTYKTNNFEAKEEIPLQPSPKPRKPELDSLRKAIDLCSPGLTPRTPKVRNVKEFEAVTKFLRVSRKGRREHKLLRKATMEKKLGVVDIWPGVECGELEQCSSDLSSSDEEDKLASDDESDDSVE